MSNPELIKLCRDNGVEHRDARNIDELRTLAAPFAAPGPPGAPPTAPRPGGQRRPSKRPVPTPRPAATWKGMFATLSKRCEDVEQVRQKSIAVDHVETHTPLLNRRTHRTTSLPGGWS